MLWLPITGGVIVGMVGLGAIYDFRVRRRGKNAVVTGSGPSSSAGTALNNLRDQVNLP